MKVKVTVSIGLVGCRQTRIIDVDDDADDASIDESAAEVKDQIIEWGWEKITEEESSGRRR